jgi:peptidoglycan/LPS O-acetylase OafA/YrhL
MRQRVDAGTILAAVGAALLLASLFVEWFDPVGTGWQVFEVVDVLLAGIAVGTVAALFGRDRPADDAPWWVPLLATVAVAVVAVQLVDPPPAARETDRATGAWLALGGALLLAAGALLRHSRISISVDVHQRETRRRVPAVDRREEPAPPAAAPVRPDPQRTQPLEAIDPDDRPREGR